MISLGSRRCPRLTLFPDAHSLNESRGQRQVCPAPSSIIRKSLVPLRHLGQGKRRRRDLYVVRVVGDSLLLLSSIVDALHYCHSMKHERAKCPVAPTCGRCSLRFHRSACCSGRLKANIPVRAQVATGNAPVMVDAKGSQLVDSNSNQQVSSGSIMPHIDTLPPDYGLSRGHR